jgi:hypothetical protein
MSGPDDRQSEARLLVPVGVPAVMLLSWDFTACWLASFGGIDWHQPELRRNKGPALAQCEYWE